MQDKLFNFPQILLKQLSIASMSFKYIINDLFQPNMMQLDFYDRFKFGGCFLVKDFVIESK